MTDLPKTYFAKRLLEHGPLTHAEFREITGWAHQTAAAALSSLVRTGVAQFSEDLGNRRRVYSLAQ